MKKVSFTKELAAVARLGNRCVHAVLTLWAVLTYDIADPILPCFARSISIEKKGFAVASVSRFLGRTKVRYVSRRDHSDGGTDFIQPDILSAGLPLAFDELGLSLKGGAIALTIPTDWVLVRSVVLPSIVKENLEEVVAQELDRITPLNSRDAYYDFRITGEDEKTVRLLVFAARTEMVDPYIKALEAAGMAVGHVSFGLAGFGALCAAVAQKDDFLLLRKDGDSCEGGRMAGGFVTTACVTNDDGTPVGLLSEILDEKGTTHHGGKGEMVVLAGLEDTALPLIERTTGLHALLLTKEKIEGRLRAIGKGDRIPLAAIGAGLSSLPSDKEGIDLRSKGRREKDRPVFVVSILLALLCIGLTVPHIMSPLRIEEKKLKAVEEQIDGKREAVKKVEALKKEAEGLGKETSIIEGFKDKRPMSLAIYKELTEILPKSVWLTRLRITDTTVELEGYAGSVSEVLPKLEQSHLFKKVEFASNTVRDPRVSADRFSIKAEIEETGAEAERKKDQKDEKKK